MNDVVLRAILIKYHRRYKNVDFRIASGFKFPPSPNTMF